jgi:predicted TIM-barrel fold metal-dependent hydrolase
MCQAYNRWMGEEIWPRGQGRLRWACVPPLRTMDKALEDLRRSREQGACAVFMHLLEFDGKLVSDPYFYPLYEEAARLDVPICFHAGNASADMHRLLADDIPLRNRFTGLGTFNLIVENQIPDKFPGLRMAFVEFGAQWLPYLILFLQRRMERRGRTLKASILRDNRLYVSCETHDDIPYLVQWVGEDNLIIGTDYGHADTSTDLRGLQTLKQRLDPRLADKILYENPRRLYGLD